MTINEDRLDKLYLRTHKCLSHLENKNKNKKKKKHQVNLILKQLAAFQWRGPRLRTESGIVSERAACLRICVDLRRVVRSYLRPSGYGRSFGLIYGPAVGQPRGSESLLIWSEPGTEDQGVRGKPRQFRFLCRTHA